MAFPDRIHLLFLLLLLLLLLFLMVVVVLNKEYLIFVGIY